MRVLRAALVGALVAGLVGVGTAPASAQDLDLALPAPTGKHTVGSTDLWLTDESRQDPWMPEVRRELMVTLYYPAAAPTGPLDQYMTPEESTAFLERVGIPGVPTDVFSTVATHSHTGARAVGRWHGLPLVVLSHGAISSRAVLRSLGEDLASHGYVVAAVEHTYESRRTDFPDGHVTGCAACLVDDQPGYWEKMTESRAADVSFVVDELTGRHPAWRDAWRIDPRRVALGGHSAGGAVSANALLQDSRLRAGFNLDGQIHVPLTTGLDRPFLMLGSLGHFQPGAGESSWEANYPLFTGWKRWLAIDGAAHQSFMDLGVLADQLGVDLGATVPGERGLATTRTYLRDFLDRYLKGRPTTLFDGPSAAYPEIVFCSGVSTPTSGPCA